MTKGLSLFVGCGVAAYSIVTTSSSTINSTTSTTQCEEEEKKNDTFHGYFPMKQLFQPKLPYPAWDDNWDGLDHKEKEATANEVTEGTTDDGETTDGGITRHVILIR